MAPKRTKFPMIFYVFITFDFDTWEFMYRQLKIDDVVVGHYVGEPSPAYCGTGMQFPQSILSSIHS